MSVATTATHKPNHLVHEASPYLQQHAHNPVDWYPWGEEAFAKARRENKPIFLSIGYSTCHWCHVMAHESFENEAIAALLNRCCVSIKVDREERPDIDKIYMTAVQATTGSGGWPMSVWLTPELKPFFCGTYFPPEARYGRPGFGELIQRVHDVWEANRAGVIQQADQITDALAQSVAVARDEPPGRPLDEAPIRLGFDQLHDSYDADHGGFGGAPKFPRPVALNFLLRYAARTGEPHARDMALHTLRAMAEGGLCDQLGGGFHRYSVDDRWLVSHFEKMLYDQAQLAASYSEAYQITHDPFYAAVARKTCDYVLRDLTSPTGGFYSAEDADSEGVEGKFYVWTRAEIEQILDDKDRAEIFCRCYGVETTGNWEHGLNVLHVALSIEQAAKLYHNTPPAIIAILQQARAKLFTTRAKRVRPHRDDKILTSWNGLMISALAKTAQALGKTPAERTAGTRSLPETAESTGAATRYLGASQHAANHILAAHYKDGRLWRTPTVRGVLDDYAFFANGLVDLYETDFDPRWLIEAIKLADTMLALFYDAKVGGFFMAAEGDPSVIVRAKEEYDGAEPSGNSMATLLLLRLAQFTDRDAYRQAAIHSLELFGPRLHQMPQIAPQLLCALDYYLTKPRQIVIAGTPEAPDTQAMVRAVHERFLPNTILILADGGARQQTLSKLLPFLSSLRPQEGKATAFVCVNYACQLPTTDLEQMIKLAEAR